MAHKFANECNTTTREKESSFVPKGQLISKGLFGVIVSTKKNDFFRISALAFKGNQIKKLYYTIMINSLKCHYFFDPTSFRG